MSEGKHENYTTNKIYAQVNKDTYDICIREHTLPTYICNTGLNKEIVVYIENYSCSKTYNYIPNSTGYVRTIIATFIGNQ